MAQDIDRGGALRRRPLRFARRRNRLVYLRLRSSTKRRSVRRIGWRELEIGFDRSGDFARLRLGFKVVAGRWALGFKRVAVRRSGRASISIERNRGRRRGVGSIGQ